MSLFKKNPDRSAAAFERLAAPCEKRIYFLCLHMTGNPEDAKDCTQESMLRAFRAFSRFKGEADFPTWLHRIAVNVCTDELRKRREVVSLDALREDTGFDPADNTPLPETLYETREGRKLISKALLSLPPDMRAALTLCEAENVPYEEAARLLSVPLGTLKSRVSRARKKLCDILKSWEQNPPASV